MASGGPPQPAQKRRIYTTPGGPSERGYWTRLIFQLRSRREQLGISQEDLDQRLNVAEGQVAKWENQTRYPSAFMFQCWAIALDYSLALHSSDGPA